MIIKLVWISMSYAQCSSAPLTLTCSLVGAYCSLRILFVASMILFLSAGYFSIAGVLALMSVMIDRSSLYTSWTHCREGSRRRPMLDSTRAMKAALGMNRLRSVLRSVC